MCWKAHYGKTLLKLFRRSASNKIVAGWNESRSWSHLFDLLWLYINISTSSRQKRWNNKFWSQFDIFYLWSLSFSHHNLHNVIRFSWNPQQWGSTHSTLKHRALFCPLSFKPGRSFWRFFCSTYHLNTLCKQTLRLSSRDSPSLWLVQTG